MQERRNSMNSEMNTSQKSRIKYQRHRAKIRFEIAQEKPQKASKRVDPIKISAHAFYPLQSMKLPQNG